jgi:hypothetical protein
MWEGCDEIFSLTCVSAVCFPVISGEWKNHFTVKQDEVLNKIFQEKMAVFPPGISQTSRCDMNADIHGPFLVHMYDWVVLSQKLLFNPTALNYQFCFFDHCVLKITRTFIFHPWHSSFGEGSFFLSFLF